MTVVESTAGEPAVMGKPAGRRIDGMLIAGALVALQLSWLLVIAYGAYLLAT